MVRRLRSSSWRGRAGSGGVVLLAVALAGCSSGGGGNAGESNAALVSSALHDAVHGGWVHEVAATTGDGHSIRMTNDVGTSEGRQVIDEDGGHATVVVLHGTAYIQGDANAVANYFQLPTSDPAKLAGRWISLTPSDSGFSTVSAAVTLQSDFSEVTFKGPFTRGPSRSLDGEQVLIIHGFVPGPSGGSPVPAVLDVTASGTVLPVALQASSGGVSESVQWSRWGQAVALTAPHDAVPIASLGG